MLEVGPTPHLLPAARRILPKADVAWLPSLRQGQDDWRVLLGTLAEARCARREGRLASY